LKKKKNSKSRLKYLDIVGKKIQLHMNRLCSTLQAKKGACLVKEVVIHLAAETWPGILGLP
jgi:hypothetical protein